MKGNIDRMGASWMERLKERIRKDGHIRGHDVLKVDSFLNHQIDVDFLGEMGKEFARWF